MATSKSQLHLPPKIYGITGGIGSGKSTVTELFHSLGVSALDADQVAKQLREPGKPGFLEIEKRFGTTDRKQLRELISKDPKAKKDLENILHPLIQKESALQLQALARNHPEAPFLLYEATLFIEAGRAKDFDGLILVLAPLDLRIERIMKRDFCTKEAAFAMIQAQMSDEERLKHAQFVISNEGTLQQLKNEVIRIFDEIRLPKK